MTKNKSTRDLEKKGVINVQQICSVDNLTYLFTKASQTYIFENLVSKFGMPRVQEIK